MRNLIEGTISGFAQPEWLYGPWANGRPKPSAQHLCDYGFRLAILMYHSKRKLVSGVASSDEKNELLLQLQELSADIEHQHATCTCHNLETSPVRLTTQPSAIARSKSTDIINTDQILVQCAFSRGLSIACSNLFNSTYRTGGAQNSPTCSLVHDLVRITTIISPQNLDLGSVGRLKWSLKQAVTATDSFADAAMRCQQFIDNLSSIPLPSAVVRR